LVVSHRTSCSSTDLWASIDTFDEYWRVASKITPTTTPTRSNSPPPTSPSATSMHTRPPSVDAAGGPSERDGAYNVRSVPVRIYLPNGPVLQDLVPPNLDDGKSGVRLVHHIERRVIFTPSKFHRHTAYARKISCEPPTPSLYSRFPADCVRAHPGRADSSRQRDGLAGRLPFGCRWLGQHLRRTPQMRLNHL
jgi:hypothetical protein